MTRPSLSGGTDPSAATAEPVDGQRPRWCDDKAMTAGDQLQTVTRGACPHDCPDTCAWTVTERDGRAVDLKADPDHPFTRGGLCAKVNHFLDDRTYNPDRILQPLRRTGPKGSGDFAPVTWDEA